MYPACGPVTNPSKAVLLNKGFYQMYPVAVLIDPVSIEPGTCLAKNMTGKIFYPNPGKYEKARIDCKKEQIAFSGLSIPTDESIPIPGFPCRRAEQHTGKKPPLPVVCRIPDGLAHTRLKTQVMISMQQKFEKRQSAVF
jgi:hypothetical protein